MTTKTVQEEEKVTAEAQAETVETQDTETPQTETVEGAEPESTEEVSTEQTSSELPVESTGEEAATETVEVPASTETTEAPAPEITLPIMEESVPVEEEKSFTDFEIKQYVDSGQITEEQGQELKYRRIAREEAKKQNQKTEKILQEKNIWGHTLSVFPEFADQNSPGYKKLKEVYASDPFLKSHPNGQFYAAALTRLMMIGQNIGKMKADVKRQTLQQKKIISKAFIENSTGSVLKKASVLTPSQQAHARKKGWSDAEYVHYMDPNQTKPFKKK